MNGSGTVRRAILHIGFAKTGTTAIQAALAAARPMLAGAGFHFARSPGVANHLRLFQLLQEDGGALPASPVARAIATEGRAPLMPAIEAEMAALPSGVGCVIFSSEHLGGLTRSAAEAQRLVAPLRRWCAEIRVVAYIRRQDDHAVSDFSQVLRGGQLRRRPLDARPKDWWAMLAPWVEVLGTEAVTPRIYERDALAGGDVLADFAAACGLAALPPAPGAARANAGLDATAQAALLMLNEDPAFGGAAGTAARRRLLAAIERCGARGRGLLPSRAEAEAYVARAAASNERVRACWFAGRESLFSADFSAYPDLADALPGPAEVARMALGLLASAPADPPGDAQRPGGNAPAGAS